MRKFLPTAFAACLFLLIVGAKWATFERSGSPMPDWDQWDAEAVELFIPWYENDHFVAHLFHPHNEHRVVITKLQNLALGVINGQWDSRVEATTNALLHAALAVGFWVVGRRWIAARWHAALFVVIAALFGLPLAWQNVLGGFHSQQYWLLGLSFVAISTLPFVSAWKTPWWLGALAAILVIGSMGSGFIASAVVLSVVAWRLWTREMHLRAVWPTLALMIALVAVGLLTRHEVAWHQKLKATTAHDFFFSIVHSLQWPWRGQHWAAAVLWLPWAIVAGRVTVAGVAARFSRSEPARLDEAATPAMSAGQVIAALGGWVFVQLLATAYARGAGADYPASRYMDTLTFGATVNALALGWLLTGRSPEDGSETTKRVGIIARQLGRNVIALAWLLTLGLGLYRFYNDVLRYELVDARKYYVKAEGHMRRYLGTNDPKQLAYPEIPFPSAQGLIDRLARPSLRALMPLPIRAPLDVAPAAGRGFAENDARGADIVRPPRLGISPATPPLDAAKSWGSYGAEDTGAAATGEWRSAPLRVTRPGGWLKFETAGQIGEPGVALELHDAAAGTVLARIIPDKTPHDTWRAAYVRKPTVPFVIVARDSDPARWLAFSGPVEMGPLSQWARLAAKHGLLLAEIAVFLTLALAGVVVLRRPSPPLRPPVSPLRPPVVPLRPPVVPLRPPFPLVPPLSRAALALALFLLIWGARLAVLDRFGSDLPYWDQWSHEGYETYVPWFERGELWKNLARPNNEHRVGVTVALNLSLVALGGQWDVRVQCLVNAALLASLAAGGFFLVLGRFPRGWALTFGLVFGLLAAAPLAWENIIGGFQSQFYFLIFFSFVAMAAVLGARPLSWRWWLAVPAGALALFSMGSGFLWIVPVASIVALRKWGRGVSWRDTLIALALLAAFGVLGGWLHAPATGLNFLHARNAVEFVHYAAQCLAWPLGRFPILATLVWWPWTALLVARFKRPAPTDAGAMDFVLAAGAWVLLQAAAVSYSRGASPGLPPSRYGDIFALGPVLAIASLALLAPGWPARTRVAAALVAFAAVGAAHTGRESWTNAIPTRHAAVLEYEHSVRDYVLTGDVATFVKRSVPFPLPDYLSHVVGLPTIRAMLPSSVRAPIAIAGLDGPPPPATTLPLLHRATRTIHAPGEWRSAPISAGTGWWKIETAGHVGQPGLSLELRSVADDRLLANVAPTKPAAGSWRAAYVPAPREPSILVARAIAPDAWVGFSEPVALSSLSYQTWRIARQGGWIALIGLVAFVILGVGLLARREERRPSASP
ncbi:MAG: hypothetical protein EXS37_07250 [Opitutus sp.]|nr:hypothetical protein [Opitutus sp.]